MYLIDTNAVIHFLGAAFPAAGMEKMREIVDGKTSISFITKIEALGYSFNSIEEQNATETFIAGSNLISINEEIIAQTILIRKTKKLKIPDAIIAATAIANNLILISRNTKDFRNVPNLRTLNLWEL